MAASRAAAAVALLLLLAASQSASGEDALDISVTVKPEHASAVNQFVWSITAPPPTPSGLQIPITGSGSGTVNYSVTFTKDLLSTTITASGIVTFENRGGKDAVLKSGQITICNGNFLIPEEGANTTASTTGCSGSTYSLPLSVNASNSKIPANGQTAVPFGGTIVINRIVSALVNNRGISGPVATAYADALLDNGQRVFSSPRTYGIGLAPRMVDDKGALATAYDEFIQAPIAALTIKPDSTTGDKIPDGLGMMISDTNTYTYQATFKYRPGKTPCGVPLTAVNRHRLIVDNPGEAPLPEPATTTATITFIGCKVAPAARFGQVTPNVTHTVQWGIDKTSNVTSLRLKRGQYGAVRYKVAAVHKSVFISYTVSGTIYVSPVVVNGTYGTKPLPVKSVTVSLSSGDTVVAYCQPDETGTTVCSFDQVSYSVLGQYPFTGKLSAEVLLKDGSKVPIMPIQFDYTSLPINKADGRQARVTDTFDQKGLSTAKAAGLKVEKLGDWLPSAGDIPLLIDEDTETSYVVKVGGAKQCGKWELTNTARLQPVGGSTKPVSDKAVVTVEVVGCPASAKKGA